jgi:CBS domain-containing protein
MNIRSFCKSDIGYIFEHETLADAAIKLRNLHLGALVVVEQRGADLLPIGIVTDRDIVVRGVARHPGTSGSIPIRDIMGREIAVAHEDDALDEVLSAMQAKGIRRMPIVDLRGSLVAVFEFDDFIDLVSKELSGLAKLVARERRTERRATMP